MDVSRSPTPISGPAYGVTFEGVVPAGTARSLQVWSRMVLRFADGNENEPSELSVTSVATGTELAPE